MNTIQGEVIIPIKRNNSAMSDMQEQRRQKPNLIGIIQKENKKE